jgi:hypothetical protein
LPLFFIFLTEYRPPSIFLDIAGVPTINFSKLYAASRAVAPGDASDRERNADESRQIGQRPAESMSLGRIFRFRDSTLIGDPAIQAYLFAGIGDSNRNGVRVDIQPKKSYFGHTTSSIRVAALRRRFHLFAA